MKSAIATSLCTNRLEDSISRTVAWLESYGDTSQDLYDFYASGYGKWAKRLYYQGSLLGKAAVAPLVLMEAFTPSLRSFFWPKTRFPLADAHYAMGYAYLYKATNHDHYLARARHFLDALIETRCAGYSDYCWGYPFDWETLRGNIPSGTPLITTIPYCYEAFSAVNEILPSEEYQLILKSTAGHVLREYAGTKYSKGGYAAAYTPRDKSMVVNASAYRAFILTRAAKDFGEERYWESAEENLDFVLNSQLSDGSWVYSMDGTDRFTDHFHTCFVMKALAKIWTLTNHVGCDRALDRGAKYYFDNLIDQAGLPIPFSRKPRLLLYKRELYDYGECMNLCLLLRKRMDRFEQILKTVVADLLSRWQHPDGFYRTRELLVGWNNVPMHRWGHSSVFRSLSLLLMNTTLAPGRH
jgi:hypothetical protein